MGEVGVLLALGDLTLSFSVLGHKQRLAWRTVPLP